MIKGDNMKEWPEKQCFADSLCVFMGVVGIFVFSYMALVSCKPQNIDSIVKRTDIYYSIIKTVVMEPAIHDKLDAEQIVRLRTIEQLYLSTRDTVTSQNDSEKLKVILECGLSICEIIDTLDAIPPDRKKELAAIRLGISILLNTLPQVTNEREYNT